MWQGAPRCPRANHKSSNQTWSRYSHNPQANPCAEKSPATTGLSLSNTSQQNHIHRPLGCNCCCLPVVLSVCSSHREMEVSRCMHPPTILMLTVSLVTLLPVRRRLKSLRPSKPCMGCSSLRTGLVCCRQWAPADLPRRTPLGKL